MSEIKYYKYHDCGVDILTDKQHTHNDTFEILYVKNGNGTIMINDQLYPIESDALYFIPPMLQHNSAPENSYEYIRSVVNISSSYLNLLASATGFSELLKKLCDNICTTLDKSHSEFIDSEFTKLKSKEKHVVSIALINIFSCLLKSDSMRYSLNNVVSDIMEYLNKNLSAKISLDAVCAEFHISKYYLCHIFKEKTGTSIMNYILGQRIALSKNLMINTDKSISEIAIASGFSCFSYFSRIFKRVEGVSPRKFRSRYKIKKL